MIGLDTETWLIQPGRLAPKLVCTTGTSIGGGKSWISGGEQAAEDFEVLLGSGERLAIHNAAFDLGVLAQARPHLLPLIFDALANHQVHCTLVDEKLWDISRGQRSQGKGWYSLEKVSKRVLDIEIDPETKHGQDAWRYRYQELDGKPVSTWPEAARDYAVLDAELHLKLARRQLERQDLPDRKPQNMYAWALHLMGCHGLRTDPEPVLKLKEELSESVGTAMSELQKYGIYRKNGTQDMAATQARVNEAYDGSPPKTLKGAVRSDKVTLAESGDPVLVKLGDISGDKKLLSSFIPVLELGLKYPITPRWNVLVLSGRSSCSGPNMQQLPRKGGVRECFIPRPGWVYVSADYGVAELRSLAQVLLDAYGRSGLADVLLEGKDPHLDLAAQVLGIPYDDAVARHANDDHEVCEARQMCKAGNFGFPGGLGAQSFRAYAKGNYGVIISEAEAKALKGEWLRKYPEMKRYFADVGAQCELGGGTFTLSQPRSGRLRGDVGFCDACNTMFQGLTADGAKHALWNVQRECWTMPSSPLYGCRPVAFIHDEILMEAPEDVAPEAAERLAQLMIEGMEVYTPSIPSVVDPVLMRRWYKGAKTVRDAGGRLQIWEPK